MLRYALAASISTMAILSAAFVAESTGARTSLPAPVVVREGKSDRHKEFAARVTAVRRANAFDPFGEIVPLPVFRLDDFRRPAFDPTLYRGGRVIGPLDRRDICELLEEVAEEYELPAPLFTRLIWQESRFRNEAVSRAGAQGIAQFMPRTAELRGLEDPFDPIQALPASADFLRELIDQFGNFGLAAAAYNGGPTRVRNWLAGRSHLPKETRSYVLRVTGRSVEYWKRNGAQARPRAMPVNECLDASMQNAASE